MAPSPSQDASVFSPLHICLGTYDGTVAGLSLTTDDSSALTMTTHFATGAHISAIRSAAVRGKFAATGGEDEVVRLYDVDARVEVGALFQHEGTITSLNFVDDHGRQLLFSSSADSSICIWRVTEWRLLKRLVAHQAAVNDVAVHPSAAVALSVANDRSLFMWNLARGKVCFSVKTKINPASAVLWSPSGDHYTLVAGKSVTFNSIDGQDVHTFTHEGDAQCAAFIDDHRLVTGANDHTVRVWDVRSKSTEHDTIYRHSARVCNLCYQSGLLLSADSGGGLVVWDPKMPSIPRIETNVYAKGRMTCMAVGSTTWHHSRSTDISLKMSQRSRLEDGQRNEAELSVDRGKQKKDDKPVGMHGQNGKAVDDTSSNANTDADAVSDPDTEQTAQASKKQKVNDENRVKPQRRNPILEGTASQRKRRKRKMKSKS